jgi:hypothetical protein
MKCSNTNGKDVVIFNESDFKFLFWGILNEYLSQWKYYFKNYFEMLMDSYDFSCMEVNINGKVYKIENEKDFVKLIKELYPNFVEKLIEIAKKEL